MTPAGPAPVGEREPRETRRAAFAQHSSAQVFRALGHRTYRLLWQGQVANATAQWMEQVARGWLIYDMTGSAFLLGLVQAVRSLPLLLLGLVGGVLADRMDRKRQLMVSQLSNMVLSILLATLVVTGRVEVWHVFVTALLAGCVEAFQQPARQSLIPSTVPRVDLVSAVALGSVAMNLSRSVGPAVAGLVVSVAGIWGAYYFQSGLFLMASRWTAQMKLPEDRFPGDGAHGSMWSSLVEGLRYIWANPVIFAILVLALLPNILGQPHVALLPVFARDVYNTGPAELGLLLGVTGVGAIFGAVVIAAMGDFERKGWFLLCTIMVLGLSLVGFGLVSQIWMAVPLLAISGFANCSYRVVNQTLLQTITADEYRGRVMSVYLLDRGMAPLGSVMAGTLATFFGAPAAVVVMGFMTFLVAVAVALKVPRVRRIS